MNSPTWGLPLYSTEMRHSVTTPTYLFRKALDNLLFSLTSQQVTPESFVSELIHNPFPTHWPTGWLPLYTMVTFRPDISYATVKRKARRQDELLNSVAWWGAALTVSVTCMAIWRQLRK